MQTYTITRGIRRTTDLPGKDDILTFEVDAPRVSMAKRLADELALAVAWHRGLVDDSKVDIEQWAKSTTNRHGQRRRR